MKTTAGVKEEAIDQSAKMAVTLMVNGDCSGESNQDLLEEQEKRKKEMLTGKEDSRVRGNSQRYRAHKDLDRNHVGIVKVQEGRNVLVNQHFCMAITQFSNLRKAHFKPAFLSFTHMGEAPRTALSRNSVKGWGDRNDS